VTPSFVVRAAAPGRVNLIGEHTDYNGGFVLPTTIPQQTRVQLIPRSDLEVHVRSALAESAGVYSLGEEQRRGDWLDYIQGLTWVLREARTGPRRGFDLVIASDVPPGAGLSSSAALEVAVLRALREAFELDLDDVMLAQLGQRAENDFVGARCGIMDQMAASLADASSALFLDTRDLRYRRVPLPLDADLVVIHSGVSHAISGGDYNTRRAECEKAARWLAVAQLRDLTVADVPRVNALPDPLKRRVRHVMSEDQRVLDAVAALEREDLSRLGTLFYESQASMRDDFEVSVPDVDLLVDVAREQPQVYGARMTGGGFGGSVVVLTVGGCGRNVGERIASTYADRSGRNPTLLVPPVMPPIVKPA
jgi:galactokinase